MTTEEQSRDAMNLSRHLKEQVAILTEHVAALERRIVVLEAFHHWAATQKFIQLEERIAKLEPQQIASDLEKISQEIYKDIKVRPQLWPDDGSLTPERASGARNEP